MNVMLVSVRSAPVSGLLKALGASEGHPHAVCHRGSSYLYGGGGLLGIGLGVGLVNLVAAFSPLKPEVTPLSIVLGQGIW